MRDFQSLTKRHKCWDAFTEWSYIQWSVPDNCILQSRDELVALCEWIEEQKIRTYLEIGCWTGKLATVLHELFTFDKLAVCDIGLCKKYQFDLELPEDADLFLGSSFSPEFAQWRAGLGPMDLVFLDADHTAQGLRADLTNNLRAGCRFLAIHDITSGLTGTQEVSALWQTLPGPKLEIVKPHSELGLEESKTGIGILVVENQPGRVEEILAAL